MCTANITFLIKYTAGSNVQVKQVSITIIDVRGRDNSEIGHKATVSLHGDKPGDFTVVVYNRVNWGGNVIIGLTEEVDKVIRNILADEGNKGYQDLVACLSSFCLLRGFPPS
jgi:hypothetical protein